MTSVSNMDMCRSLAGGLAGVCAVGVGHPFDSVKVRIQIEPRESIGFFRVSRRMFANEGISCFFRGITAPLAMRFVVTGSFFAINGYLKDKYISHLQLTDASNTDPNKVLPLSVIGAIGAISGMILAPIVTPFEMLKIQLQSDVSSTSKMHSRRFESARDCIRVIFRNRACFRGYLLTTLRLAPGWGVYVWTYEASNRLFDRNSTLGQNDVCGSWQTSARVIIGGSLAGASAWATSYPFDFVKTRVQSHSIEHWNYLNTEVRRSNALRMADVISQTYRRHGLKGFFRGLKPCVFRAVPVNLTQFWTYEFFLNSITSSPLAIYEDDS